MKLRLLAHFGLTAALAIAQTADQPVIRVRTRLVQFNVIAVDQNGPVAGLNKENFTILDHGHRREIAVFRMDSRSAGGDNKAAPLPPNTFSNRNSQEANSTILLFDSANTRFADQAYARLQIIKFIERLEPGDRIAIYSLGHRLKVVHDFSSDRPSLVEAAKKLKVELADEDLQAAHSAMDQQANRALTGRGTAGLRRMANNASADQREAAISDRVDYTEGALTAIARYFESVPGRKNLVWVSSAFPVSIGRRFDKMIQFQANVDAASRALINANVAVYPIDARGILPSAGYGASGPSGRPNRRSAATSPGTAERETMTLIADQTGGKAFFDNDIQGSIRRAIADSEVTYTLGFYLEAKDIDSEFHDIKVSVDRKGVEVRTRRGYFAYEEVARAEAERDAVMRQVLFAPLDAAALPLTVQIARSAQPGVIDVASTIDPKTLSFVQKDGRYSDDLDFVIAQQAADGHNIKVAAEVVGLAYTPERYQQIIASGLQIRRPIKLEPGARMIRIMVYDRNSDLVGSARGSIVVAE